MSEERTARLELKVRISESLDGLIEQCRRARAPLARSLETLLARACELMGARGATARAFDEQLERRTVRTGEFAPSWEASVPERFEADPIPEGALALDGATVIVRRLDCADEVVGVAAFAFAGGLDPETVAALADECRTAAETIDNFLEGIAAAARKHRLSVSASAALRTPLLEQGADRAVALLSAALGLEEAALVFADTELHGLSGVQYRVYRQGAAVADSVDRPDPRLEPLIAKSGRSVLDPAHRDLLELFGGPACVETALINGLCGAPVGKLLVRNALGNLGPEAVDVLHIFAECLSQRLVDYNRERRHLSYSFAPDVVTALIREPDYVRRFLIPRVEPVAILFADMASFTAISEQVLCDAAKIAELIDAWSNEAVRILFENGGVFDKLVGDCVIGLFGPPFFRDPPTRRVAQAARAAVEIGRMTRRLGAERGYDALIRTAGIGEGLGTAAGVNFGATSIGLFGPNLDYTGFSSHMNNAARLQGVARFDEVFIMRGAAEAAAGELEAAGLSLSGPEHAKVKNVRDPIAYYRVVPYCGVPEGH